VLTLATTAFARVVVAVDPARDDDSMLRLSRSVGLYIVATLLLFAVATPATNAASTVTTTTAPSAGAVPSACALLTPSEVQSVLGGTVSSGDLTTAPNGGETICEWTVVTSPHGSGFSTQLDVKTAFTAKDFKQQRQIASGPTKTVKHVGDSAFSEQVKVGPQVFDDLWVHAGATAFRLEVLKNLGSKPLKSLASIVLTRLG
jgi:hypothetical protein